ncbi:PEP-CTERM system TPR-repeat protein PrsT [Azospirillaceae bacterium]
MTKRFLGLAGGMIIVGLTTSAAFGATPPSLVDSTQSMVNNGDVNGALIQLKKMVKDAPTSGEARFALGALEFRLGDMVAAEKDLTLARDNNYPAAKVNPLLAVATLALGQHKKLLTKIDPCPDDAQCRSDVLATHVRAHLALHDIPAADAASKEAMAAVPNNQPAQLSRVLVLIALSDYRAAEEIVDQILAADPKSVEGLALKGDLRRQANNLDEAITQFRASLAINPRDITVRQRLALALAALNRNDEATAEVKKVLEQAPSAVIALYLKAMLEVRVGKMVEAMDTVRSVETNLQQIPRGVFLLAIIHAGNDHLEQALDYATRFHTNEPDNLAGSKLLAGINYRLHAYTKVIDVLAPLRERFDDDSEALELLGSAYMAEGWIKEANEVLGKVTKIKPDDVMAQARLAVAQTRQASTRDTGVRELEALIAADNKNTKVGLALLFSYLSEADYEKAIAVGGAMVKAQPDSPLPLTVRGSVRLAKGDEAEALADFNQALEKSRDFIPAASYVAEIDMRNGRFDHARQMIDGVLDRTPKDLRLLMIRARIEARANKPEAMIPFLRTAIERYSTESEPRIQLMQVLAGLKRTSDAILVADDLARTQARNPTVLDLVARTYITLGMPENGIELYRRLQNNFPESAAIHERLGLALMSLNHTEDARTAFDRATVADRSFISAWRNRAMIELKASGGLNEALAVANKAVVQNAKNEEAMLLEGDVLAVAGHMAEAEKSYAKVLAETSSPKAAAKLFRTILRIGDRQRARAFLVKWTQDKPDDIEALTALAEDYLVNKDYKFAVVSYEKLLNKFPRNAAYLNNLATAYDILNDSRALETARRAFLLQSNSPDIIDTYGFMLYNKGASPNETKRGAELLNQARFLASNNPQIAYHLAKIKADAKDTAGALALLKPVIDSKTVFSDVEDARRLYAQLGGK